MHEVLVVDAVRTPIGKVRGALAHVRPDDLAAHVLGALLERQPACREALGEVVFGCTNQAGEDNRNVARMATLLAGLPYEVPAVTVNRLCGSGLEAVLQAARAIRLGELEVAVAGGVESMTRAPYAMEKPAEAFSRTPPRLWDTSLGWRFPNPRLEARFPLLSMGETAENVAERWGIDREAQDAFAAESHRRAAAAWQQGAFADEIVPVPLPPADKGEAPRTFDRDECVRPDTTVDKLARLPPAFRKGGTVTAGNSSPLNDGAAAVVLATDRFVARHGLRPLGRLVAGGVAGVDPNLMGIGPVPATRRALERAGWSIADVDVVELNEAFAAQALACMRELELDPSRVNVRGGAIAIGHPIGCSGARIVATLLHAMRARGARRGLATLCIGVGQGLAALFDAA
ncbi:MAG: thiolase family protein [Myxococcales bacterium]|nr:thiolase family protein [Myxococcales bacterium]